MNKLILIGNGFDLAHRLPTSYNHFVDHFWTHLKENYKKKWAKEMVFVDEKNAQLFDHSIKTKNFNTFWYNVVRYAKERNFFIDNDPLRTTAGKEELAFEWKNTFFKRICVSQMINWVAIEEEYHRQLVSIVKTPALVGSLADENALRQKREQARMLNKEFDQVKDLLKHYLVTQVEQKYDDAKINPQTSKFSEVLTANNFFSIHPNPIDFGVRVKRYAQAFSLKEDQKEVLQIIDRCKAGPKRAYYLSNPCA